MGNSVGKSCFGDRSQTIKIKSSPDQPLRIDLLTALSMTAKYQEWWEDIGKPLLVAVAQKIVILLEAALWQDAAVGAEQRRPSPVKGGPKRKRQRSIPRHVLVTALQAPRTGPKLGELKLRSVLRRMLVRAMCFAHMHSTVKAFAGNHCQWSFAWDPGLHATQTL